MFADSYEFLTNYIKAGKRTCSLKTLRQLANSDLEKIRLRVAENTRTPRDVLELLAGDKSADVKIAVGTNPNTPLEVVLKLADDEDHNVRLGLADDTKTPVVALERLADDANPYVSCRAKQTIIILRARELNSRRFMTATQFTRSDRLLSA